MKLDPNKIKRPEAERHSFDIQIGDDADTLVIKKLGYTAIMAAQDEAARLTTEYVTGWGIKGEDGYIPPNDFPFIGDEVVHPSASAFDVACMVHYAQIVDKEEDRYSPIDLVLLMVDETIAVQLKAAYYWVMTRTAKKKDDGKGNSLGKSEKPSTPTVSTSSKPRRKSSKGQTPSLSVSTTA